MSPSILFNFLKTEYDIRALIAGMRLVRKITEQQAFASLVAEEIFPGVLASDYRRLYPKPFE